VRNRKFFVEWFLWCFAGVFEKTRAKTWCFGGEFVVICVVNVVIKQPYLGPGKCDTGSGFIF
jgi:hypothetical protein